MLKVRFCFKFEVRMSKVLSSVQMNQGPFRLETTQLFSTVHLLTDGSDHVSIVYKTLQSAPTLTPAPSYRSPLPCRPSPPPAHRFYRGRQLVWPMGVASTAGSEAVAHSTSTTTATTTARGLTCPRWMRARSQGGQRWGRLLGRLPG
jgi:hypothetical protein